MIFCHFEASGKPVPILECFSFQLRRAIERDDTKVFGRILAMRAMFRDGIRP